MLDRRHTPCERDRARLVWLRVAPDMPAAAVASLLLRSVGTSAEPAARSLSLWCEGLHLLSCPIDAPCKLRHARRSKRSHRTPTLGLTKPRKRCRGPCDGAPVLRHSGHGLLATSMCNSWPLAQGKLGFDDKHALMPHPFSHNTPTPVFATFHTAALSPAQRQASHESKRFGVPRTRRRGHCFRRHDAAERQQE